jgi:outer membrane protein TolC
MQEASMRTAVLTIMLVLLGVAMHPLPAPAQTPRLFTLAELITQADSRNPVVIAARQSVQASEAAVAIARSGRGPTLTASSSVGTSGGGTSVSTTQGFSTAASIASSYVIYDSGQIQYAVRQAEANVKAARLSLEITRQDIAQTVALAYVTVLRAARAVQQREQVVVQNRELVRLAEGQFRAGVVARADVVRAQAGLAAAEGDLIAAQNAVDQAYASLNQSVGSSPLTPIAVAAAPDAPRVTVAAADLAGLVERRSEIQRGMAQIEAAEAAVLLAQAGGGLRVTLDGRVTQSVTPNSQTTYSIGSGISFPLSDAGRTQAQVNQANANLAAARANIEAARLTVQQQATSALLSILNARARITSAQAQLAFAQESLRLAQGRYAAGAGPFLEVVDAQTALVQAEVALATAQFDELSGVISLRYALGRSVVDGAI